MEHKVKVGEIERPPGLPLVQLLGCHKILQVLVIHPDLTLVFCAFNKVPPFLESLDDCQHLFVMDYIVLFDRGERLREEGNQVPFSILCRYLGEIVIVKGFETHAGYG